MRHDTASTLDAKQRYESHLFSLYGPKPDNIFKTLRQQLELSHEDLAQKMFTTKGALIRLEQGCFETPPQTVIDWWLANEPGLSELQLTDAYEGFQDAVRRRHRQFFGPTLIFSLGATSPHPLKQLRAKCYTGIGASVMEVAKALCIQQQTLAYWEKNWRLQKSVPKLFCAALIAIGYAREDVAQLCREYIIWREAQLNSDRRR